MVQRNAFDMELLSVEKYWDKNQAFITEHKKALKKSILACKSTCILLIKYEIQL